MPKNGNDILKIIQVRSRDRIILPREVMDALSIERGDYLAFLRSTSGGVNLKKVDLQIER